VSGPPSGAFDVHSPMLDGTEFSLREIERIGRLCLKILVVVDARHGGRDLSGVQLHITARGEHALLVMRGTIEVVAWTPSSRLDRAWSAALRVRVLPTAAWRKP
jgi:hypothetical protein